MTMCFSCVYILLNYVQNAGQKFRGVLCIWEDKVTLTKQPWCVKNCDFHSIVASTAFEHIIYLSVFPGGL